MGKSNEQKTWLNSLRSRFGRKNGVFSNGLLDNPDMERKHNTSKHNPKVIAKHPFITVEGCDRLSFQKTISNEEMETLKQENVRAGYRLK